MSLKSKAVEIADAFGLPAGLFMALIEAESSWNQNAVSRFGAIGLTQVMPATATALGYNPNELRRDPVLQMEAGARYLQDMYRMFPSWEHALAAYNAGPHNVRKYNGVPPFKETRNYVKKVLELAETYKEYEKKKHTHKSIFKWINS